MSQTPPPASAIDPGRRSAWSRTDPLLRALVIFLAGMILLLAVDFAGMPRGPTGQDRAVAHALEAGNQALSSITDADDAAGDAAPDDASAAARRERAQSAAFFLEQANLAWRRGDATSPAQVAAARGSAAALAVLGKLWVLGWLLLPFGALAARLACPGAQGRHPHWALLYGASALGGSAAVIALALAIHALGAAAPFVLAPMVSAIVMVNALLLREHAQIDRAATLLRLAPILVILTVGLMLARVLLLSLAILP